MYDETRNQEAPRVSRIKLALIGFGLIGGFFVIAEHRAHVLPFLPYLFLAACPLLHMFMHGGHGRRGHDQGDIQKDGAESKSTGDEPSSRHAEIKRPDNEAIRGDASAGGTEHDAAPGTDSRSAAHVHRHGGGL